MLRSYYTDSIAAFREKSSNEILGELTHNSGFAVETTQRDAWVAQIEILQPALERYEGAIHLEYAIPRMGKRIDVVLLIGPVIFVIEFKAGETRFNAGDLDQVWDYALDLKNFHEASRTPFIAPILIPTRAPRVRGEHPLRMHDDLLFEPIRCTASTVRETLDAVLARCEGEAIDHADWVAGRYHPTPTIVEAALALYGGHAVEDISRTDAAAINLADTSDTIDEIIKRSKERNEKAVCFVTGVPGAGKTLVGLNIATKHSRPEEELYSVFLSGNGPLVNVLREALARDRVAQAKSKGKKLKKGVAVSEVKEFIQSVHHFRDEYLIDRTRPPIEHVALFDEAQRAWNIEQTVKFMNQKRGGATVDQSEPEFLLSVMDRHPNWAVIVCLVGGGQEINSGEAGIKEWIASVARSFPEWRVYMSSRLTDSEYDTEGALDDLRSKTHQSVEIQDHLHLAVSMRSFRAENVSLWVKQVLDLDPDRARETLKDLKDYPIVLTRSLDKAKAWLRKMARGSERYGIVVSSQAERLRPHAIHVKAPMNPIHWFLHGKGDVRSSYYLEDVATEFHVQGLELDWACVTWDADFRYTPDGWEHWSFKGSKWQKIRKEERQIYLKNAYRVLLTRARQGMVLVVPEGHRSDMTRSEDFYDPTFLYLNRLGLTQI